MSKNCPVRWLLSNQAIDCKLVYWMRLRRLVPNGSWLPSERLGKRSPRDKIVYFERETKTWLTFPFLSLFFFSILASDFFLSESSSPSFFLSLSFFFLSSVFSLDFLSGNKKNREITTTWYYVNSRNNVDSEKIRVPDGIWTHDPPWTSRML